MHLAVPDMISALRPESDEADESDCWRLGGICTAEAYCPRESMGLRGRCEAEDLVCCHAGEPVLCFLFSSMVGEGMP